MARPIPAICDVCGTIFPAPFRFGENANITIGGDGRFGPCPKCGKCEGKVANGIYTFAENVLRVVAESPADRDRLQRIVDLLARLNENKISADKAAEELGKEFNVLDPRTWIPKSRTELIATLALIVALSKCDGINPPTADELVNSAVVKNEVTQSLVIKNKVTNTTINVGIHPTDPCPCGNI